MAAHRELTPNRLRMLDISTFQIHVNIVLEYSKAYSIHNGHRSKHLYPLDFLSQAWHFSEVRFIGPLQQLQRCDRWILRSKQILVKFT